MSKENILQLFFELINDSLEWGIGNDDYGMYIDGCAAMTGKLLEKIEGKDCNKTMTEDTHDKHSVTGNIASHSFNLPTDTSRLRSKM